MATTSEPRDSVLQHGTSERGMDLVFDRLAEVLASALTAAGTEAEGSKP